MSSVDDEGDHHANDCGLPDIEEADRYYNEKEAPVVSVDISGA